MSDIHPQLLEWAASALRAGKEHGIDFTSNPDQALEKLYFLGYEREAMWFYKWKDDNHEVLKLDRERYDQALELALLDTSHI